MDTSISDLIEQGAAALGGQKALADILGVSPQAVAKWKRTKVPAERVLDIERATEGRVSRHDLRPDLYPRDTAVA